MTLIQITYDIRRYILRKSMFGTYLKHIEVEYVRKENQFDEDNIYYYSISNIKRKKRKSFHFFCFNTA